MKVREISYKTNIFALLFFFQFLEKLAYTIVLIQLPIYIAQKDATGGLRWSQETKGLIFFLWALVQNSIPLLAGYLADKFTNKKIIQFGLLFSFIGFISLVYSNSILLFIIATIFIGIGSGTFKPAFQGTLASYSNDKQSYKVWAIYIITINFAFFAAGFISKTLKDIEWIYVFITSGIITFANLLLVSIFFPSSPLQAQNTIKEKSINDSFNESVKQKFTRELILILSIATCFMLIYMQFYESLPNFIYDWIDTSKIINELNLPHFLLMNTPRGMQLSYEWLYSINPILTILFVFVVSYFLKKVTKLIALVVGLTLVTTGFFLCGFFNYGYYLVFGIIIYTLGEMIVNPKLLEIISEISPKNQKSRYFGLLSISSVIGLSVGALSGGYLYKHIAEKYYLATKYLKFSFSEINQVNTSTNPMESLCKLTNLNQTQLTVMLWEKYHPYLFWVPFIFVGLAGIFISIVLIQNNRRKIESKLK